MRLQGKVAVITGAGSGIGLAIAKRFAGKGAKVVAGDWNAACLDEAVENITRSGGTIKGPRATSPIGGPRKPLVDMAITAYGRLDVLVNDAGVMDFMQGVGELADDIWRWVLAINLDGPMFTMRRAVPRMVEQGGGSIVNIASTAAIEGARPELPTRHPSTRWSD